MLITRNDKKEVKFGALKKGDVFKDANDIFMKIEEIENDGIACNVIFLETGNLGFFHESEKVIIVHAELIVN